MEGAEHTIELITRFMSGGAIQMASAALEEQDNEIITQMLLTCFNSAVSNPTLHQMAGTLNGLMDSINVALSVMGYMMHVTQIRRSELNNYIYYSRITPDGQMLRSNYHPINLINFMQREEIPESFLKLFADQDYLRNITNVWDRGHPDSLLLISFQKINLRVR